MEMIQKITHFLRERVWQMELTKESPLNRFLIKTIRLLILAGRRFMIHDCFSMASALTFYVLLSIVPVLAAAFMVAKGFGFQENFQIALLKRFPEQELILGKLIEFAMVMLEKTKEGVIGGIGALVLLWTVVKLLNNIEESFNRIFQVEKSRSLGRKFSDYLALIMICPILFVVASGINIYLSGHASALSKYLNMQETLGPILQFGIDLIPYTIIWGLFSFMYLFIPNTKIELKSGVIAGVVAGSLYQVWQWIYIHSQIWAANYGAIYGSFAAIPLFLMWLQISWFIVLAGAEFCASLQNFAEYEFPLKTNRLSHSDVILLCLMITHKIVQNFFQDRPPLTAIELSRSLKIALPLIKEGLQKLSQATIISNIHHQEDSPPGYIPARPPERLTLQYVIEQLDYPLDMPSSLPKTPLLVTLTQGLQKFHEMNANSPSNYALKDV